MPIEFACKYCKKMLRVPDGSGGLACECPACAKMLTIPGRAAAKAPAQSGSGGQVEAGKVRVPCPQCDHVLMCDRELIGKRGQCKRCGHVFTISQGPALHEAAATDWVFECPKCQQLFEGREDMRGRKGKCHACDAVFTIQLRTTDRSESTTGAKAASKPDAAVSQSKSPAPAGGSRQRLGQATTQNNSRKVGPSTHTPPASQSASRQRPANSRSVANMRLACPSCEGIMEVPGEAAGQTTACPYCQQLLQIPAASGSPGAAGAVPSPAPLSNAVESMQNQYPSNSTPSVPAPDWTSLGDFSGATLNPYAAPQSLGQSGYQQPANYAAPRSLRRSPEVYILPGIFMTIFAAAILLMIVYNIFRLSMQLPEVQQFSPAAMTGFWVASIGLIVLALIHGVLILVGGIAMIRRAGLTTARTGAIACCFPCLMCLGINIPFGIWATIVCFTGRVQRDFDN